MASLQSGKINRIHSTPLAIHISTISPIRKSSNDLWARIRGLLYLGKLTGVIPLQGLGQKEIHCFGHPRSWRTGCFISGCISVGLAVNMIVSFIGMCRINKKNAAELAWAASSWVFYSYGTFLYTYFLRNADEFHQLFPKWSALQLNVNLFDKKLSRDSGIITCIIFTSAVLENLLLQFIEFPAFESGGNNSTNATLEIYYQRSHKYWADLIPYHSFWAIFVLISNKLALYSWSFVDILIAVLSRAIYAKFKLLYEDVERRIDMNAVSDEYHEGPKKDDLIWIKLARDHSSICNLLGEFERFLSPLIFCSYGINIYFACLQLFLGLTPNKDPPSVKSTLHTIYTTWSFVHLIVRLYVVSISAANVNVHAHLVSRALRKCPVEDYSVEVERLERKVNAGPEIGLSGLGCFTITKPFILSIIGVVFTFEIVLLQATPQQSLLGETNCTTT